MRAFSIVLLAGSLAQYSWSQDITSFKDARPFEVSGGANIGFSTYHSNRATPRYAPFSYTLSASPTFSFYGFSIPVTVVYSEKQRSFRQPFNRFGLSPSYKWIRLHAGHRNVHFNPYTLAGRTFLGGGVELTPGRFRFGFIYGRFNKAVQNLAGLESFIEPTFDRKGYALKIGIGSQKNFFELSFLKAEDQYQTPFDTTGIGAIRPAENAVVGISSKLTFLQYITFELRGAASAYSENIFSSKTGDDFKGRDLVEKIFVPRISSRLSFAGDAGISFQLKSVGLRLGYKRIDPNYASMGAYRFLTDIEDYTIGPSLSLLKNKVRLTGRYGIQRNNINEARLQNSTRKIGSVALNLNGLGRFSSSFNYSNYRTDVVTTDELLIPDSFDIIQISENIQGNMSIQLGEAASSSLSMVLFRQSFNRESELIFGANANISTGGSMLYNWYQRAKNLKISAGVNGALISAPMTEIKRLGFQVSAQKKISSKWRITLRANVLQNTIEDEGRGISMAYRSRVSYQIAERQRLNFQASYLKRGSQLAGRNAFADFRTQLNYSISL